MFTTISKNYTMKELRGKSKNCEKLQKNFGCLLFLVGLLFVQGVYGSELGLNKEQKEALKGFYLEFNKSGSDYYGELTFQDSNFKLFDREFVEQCDIIPPSTSKSCWKTAQGDKLVLCDDDTLLLYQGNKAKPFRIYYKIELLIKNDQIDAAATLSELETEIEPEILTNSIFIADHIIKQNFAELKALVSELIMPRYQIGSPPATNQQRKEEGNSSINSGDNQAEVDQTRRKEKNSSINSGRNAQADVPWYKKPNFWICICVGVFCIGGLCCIIFFHTSNKEVISDVDDPSNYFPSTTDLVLEIMENTARDSMNAKSTQYSLFAGPSTIDLTITESTIDFEPQSSELSEENKSEALSVSSLDITEEASILTVTVKNMKSESESSIELKTSPERKNSQSPTKKQKKKQKNSQISSI